MESYDTLSEAMHAWRLQGYLENFDVHGRFLYAQGKDFSIAHHEFKVDKFYRFEGETDPSDESILYAISSHQFSIKGLLVTAYGMYVESGFSEMIQKLSIRKDNA